MSGAIPLIIVASNATVGVIRDPSHHPPLLTSWHSRDPLEAVSVACTLHTRTASVKSLPFAD